MTHAALRQGGVEEETFVYDGRLSSLNFVSFTKEDRKCVTFKTGIPKALIYYSRPLGLISKLLKRHSKKRKARVYSRDAIMLLEVSATINWYVSSL